MQRLSGVTLAACGEFISSGSRLFPNAIRIGGWSHQFGNIMKSLCHLVREWPKRQVQWFHVCQFYRNTS